MLISYKHKLPGSYDFCNQGCSRNYRDGDLLKEHTFRFNTNHKRKYIVSVEEYRYNVFVLKFYLKDHRLSSKRFNILTKDFDGFKILSTLIAIVLYIYDKINNDASFGFIGTPLLTENNTCNTKRFRVYQKLAKKHFSPDTFDHAVNIDNSSYLLLNKKVSDQDLKSNIEDMFNRLYIGMS